ncbi:hypothetical protein ACYOEI_39540, partial [Singulisphaera rosea]
MTTLPPKNRDILPPAVFPVEVMMRTPTHPTGIIRREFLQVGFSGFFGMGLQGLLAGRSLASPAVGAVRRTGRAKSMIVVFLTGGLSHL